MQHLKISQWRGDLLFKSRSLSYLDGGELDWAHICSKEAKSMHGLRVPSLGCRSHGTSGPALAYITCESRNGIEKSTKKKFGSWGSQIFTIVFTLSTRGREKSQRSGKLAWTLFASTLRNIAHMPYSFLGVGFDPFCFWLWVLPLNRLLFISYLQSRPLLLRMH